MAGSLDEMRKPELMKYAASLGVATRKEGTKLWRKVKDVRDDCKVREADQQQRSLADARAPGSASPSQAAPSAPSRGERRQAGPPGPGQATPSAPSRLCQPGPGSASSSRGVPTQAVPKAGVGAEDLESMGKADLRKLATSLGISTRAGSETVALLRVACKRALEGQGGLARFFARGVCSQGGFGPEVGIEGGGAAPVSDSPPGVAHSQASKRRRPGGALRPAWVRKGQMARQT